MDMQGQVSAEITEQPNKMKIKKCNCLVAILVLAFFAVGGFVFGGVELWQRIQKENSSASTTVLSVDKESKLGQELYEQIHNVELDDICNGVRHPLYEAGNKYTVGYEDISSEDRFEIIAKGMPAMANLVQGEDVVVSREEMQNALDSVGFYSDIDDKIFGFGGIDPEDSREQSIVLSNYEIAKINDEEYLISVKERERLDVSCVQARYTDAYEYIGLSNTIDNQLIGSGEDDRQKAMIVLERKTIDAMDESGEAKSNGYYGVLFEQGQETNEGKYFWLGAYYLGNIIEE